MNGDRDRDPHWSTDWAPKFQMRSRRRENMSKEVRTARGVPTHWDDGTDLMGAHQGLLDWDWWSMWSNRTLWMWLTMKADWEANDNCTRFWLYCMYWRFGSLVCLDTQLPRPGRSREGLGLPTGQGTLTSLRTGEGGGGGREMGGSKKKLINKLIKKWPLHKCKPCKKLLECSRGCFQEHQCYAKAMVFHLWGITFSENE